MLLTRAAGREACSPGRVGLVLIQFICRCVQHHQEKKSGPQRHRPLCTGYTTKQKETPPAVCVIHRMTLQETSFCSAPEMERIQAVTSGLPDISCSFFLMYFSSTYIFFFFFCFFFFFLNFIISFTFDHSLSSPLALTDWTDVKSACVYMGALNITSCACGPIRTSHSGPWSCALHQAD